MNSLPIGVFDSGLGGLTVAKAIASLLPSESIMYFGDLAHLPYGSKGRATVKKISLECVNFLSRQGIKLLVVACNTATSIALDDIVKSVDIPVVGVILPGAEEAVCASENRKVGVIGTTRTVVSNAYYDSISQLEPAARIFQYATPLLVSLIEEGWIGHPAFYLILEEYLRYFDDKEIDTLVLGCTHYPLIKENLRLLRPHLKIVDSAHATARKVKQVLESRQLFNDSGVVSHRFFTSDISETFMNLSEKIMGGHIDIELVSL